ncbi:LuxR C-terminal-related transcriptional regulator [Tengunoibacter tsumagoiensis]|uniref:LuxR family transcriptional regulator n=1 Tax=Tengunoibacter tsumagoiensis TaxID=2014871 RepID=A0A401ZWB6_9CHLR|nr:LuxR C-terminal-related transcriptional regulator [Tengunoibacter tsumagoiensis]GCE11173.1 LuxR family transcriptional regulator [Tengunoibacter tsumagoiensis]
MPRYTPAQLRWSEQAQNYVFSMDDQTSTQTLTNDWLEHITSFSFHSRWGMHYTVRKQRVQRGSSYWYAYRRLHGRVAKRYLGKSTDLTLVRLEEIARLLENVPDSYPLAFQSMQETGLPQPAREIVYAQDARQHLSSVEALPLLVTKLSPPRLPSFLLDRSRLFTLLDAGREGPLTLLSAPAGFGKTTLVRQWMATRCASPNFPPVAWVSLETEDNDPLRFWRYLIAACQTFQVDLTQVHSTLTATTPQPPFLPSDLSTVLTTLLNALAQSPIGGILVLEDCHVITEHAIYETISFFLNHLPAPFHLIMITRSDPPFSLARFRTRSALCEVRAADLRFSQEETTILLHHSLPFLLETATIQRLHDQLEGWGTGLHLVKLALQRTTTPAEEEQTLALFSRNNASLQEYFVAEVLHLQPEPVQRFLLQTSILTRLTASLCDAVTEQQNSQDMLTLLEHLQIFLEALDADVLHLPEASQQWYRYHALFSEAMRNEARRRFSEDDLHRLFTRASSWYEVHGSLEEAIATALAAQDHTRAAILIERSIEKQTFPGELHEPHTLQRWLEHIPETLLEQRPVLCLSYATALLFQNTSWQPDAPTLPLLEKLLQRAEDSFRVEDNLPKLGELFAFRSLLALRQGNMQTVNRYATQALDWLEQTQYIWRGIALSIVAEELIQKGDFQQARAALLEARTLCEIAKNHYFQQVARTKLAQVFFELGEIQQATALYRQVLVGANEGGPLYVRCYALVGLAELCYEANDLESASRHAQEAIHVSQTHHLVYYEVRAMLILARVQQAQGQAVVAQRQLTALLDRIPASLPYLAQEIQTALACLALSVGNQMIIQRWATGRSPHPNFSRKIEEELLVSRWFRSQDKLEEALSLLEPLLIATREVGHTRLMLEVLVEMILVKASIKRKTEALQLLRDMLAQAFDRNATRLFLDAGEQMEILLRSLLPQLHDQPLLAYLRTLLSAFPVQQHNGAHAQATSLIEPLTPQEMRVLRLLVEHRSNAEIAKALVVSINTVRTQVQSIYSKLGVHKRSAASEVARELHLL